MWLKTTNRYQIGNCYLTLNWQDRGEITLHSNNESWTYNWININWEENWIWCWSLSKSTDTWCWNWSNDLRWIAFTIGRAKTSGNEEA